MPRLKMTLLAILAVGTISLADGPQEPAADKGIDVLTRGPVHEAYASAVNAEPTPGPLVPKAPPAPIEELPPDEKPEGDNVIWIPGYWSWDEDRADFIWVSGFWRVPPPDRQWVPGAWHESNGEWQYTAGFWTEVQQADFSYLPQPPAPVNSGPPTPAPSPNHLYAPGAWVYRDTRYVWRPGFWYAYRPNWIYVPAHYNWTPYGYVFVDSYWDYPLRQRGVLFAPVAFNVSVVRAPAFVYRPRYVVYDDFLYGALFVRPGCGYYFGDYFEARYTKAGYQSWFNVTIGVGGHDPLYSYYRVNRGNTWAVGINNLYVARFDNPAYRPPRTLVQQNVVVNNFSKNTTIVNNNTTIINNVQNVTAVAPITQVNKTQVVNLTRVTPAQQQLAAQNARDFRQASVQRAKLESSAPSNPGGPPKTGQPFQPRTVKLDLPKSPATPTGTAPPPPPLPIRNDKPVIAPNPAVIKPATPSTKPPVTTPPVNTPPIGKPPTTGNPPSNTKPPVAPPQQNPPPTTKPSVPPAAGNPPGNDKPAGPPPGTKPPTPGTGGPPATGIPPPSNKPPAPPQGGPPQGNRPPTPMPGTGGPPAIGNPPATNKPPTPPPGGAPQGGKQPPAPPNNQQKTPPSKKPGEKPGDKPGDKPPQGQRKRVN